MFDLEKLSEVCAETGRYTFFFSSWPLNMSVPLPARNNSISIDAHLILVLSLGGCASPPNAAVSDLG